MQVGCTIPAIGGDASAEAGQLYPRIRREDAALPRAETGAVSGGTLRVAVDRLVTDRLRSRHRFWIFCGNCRRGWASLICSFPMTLAWSSTSAIGFLSWSMAGSSNGARLRRCRLFSIIRRGNHESHCFRVACRSWITRFAEPFPVWMGISHLWQFPLGSVGTRLFVTNLVCDNRSPKKTPGMGVPGQTPTPGRCGHS